MPRKNKIVYGASFLRDAGKLPRRIQDKLAKLLAMLADDEFDPRLHTKALSTPLQGKYSFRITRDWRVSFKFLSPNVIYLLLADHRDQIYERVKRLP